METNNLPPTSSDSPKDQPVQNTQPNPTLRPMNEPHTPISEAEQNHQMHHESPKSGVNTLLTLTSLLVLAGVVGITLWLYIQNKSQKTASSTPSQQAQNLPNSTTTQEKARVQKVMAENNGVLCAQFDTIEDALENVDIACGLNLSGQELDSLPEEITRLKYLVEINLKDNQFNEFPEILLKIPSLMSINLENNQLSQIPEDIHTQLINLQSLKLGGNNVSSELIDKYSSLPLH